MSGVTGNFIVAQGGGPTAVINASLAGAVREAVAGFSGDASILGARRGIAGFLEEDFVDLRRPVAKIFNH